ncbi:MAG: flagellar hook protein FlgE [Methylocystaceae bacterium]
MLRSMYSGVAGLKAHQTRMDVIGNNIANVNTIGFKKGRVNFYDTLYQSMKGASAPVTNCGGVNGQSVGLGTSIASVDTITTTGGTQTTNKMSDLMIQGNGYFILQGTSGTEGDRYYTRAGNFDFDSTGKFVSSSNGLQVVGYNLDPTSATLALKNNLEPINVSSVKNIMAKATSALYLEGNLNAEQLSTDLPHPITQEIYDSLGRSQQLSILCSKVDFTTTVTPATTGTDVDTAGLPHTFTWTDATGYNNVTDYEYTLDGGNTWQNCTAHPQPVPNADYAIGAVMVRVKGDSETGRGPSLPLRSTVAFTHEAAAGEPTVPGGLTIDDTNNTFTFTNNGVQTNASDYQYSIDGGVNWTSCTGYTQSVGDVNIPINGLRVRAKALAGPTPPGIQIANATAFASKTVPPNEITPAVTSNTWRLNISLNGNVITPASGTIYAEFDTQGRFVGVKSINGGAWSSLADTVSLTNLVYPPPASGASADLGNIALDFSDLTQSAQGSSAWAGKVDADNPEGKGYKGGALDSYTIDQNGFITGKYSNGVTRVLARLQTATFDNPAGLTQAGQSMYTVSNNSGAAQTTEKIGEGSHSAISPGTLEMSNVDLSEEFTNMITTQRGFQANSRIITTSDSMLEELLSLKR